MRIFPEELVMCLRTKRFIRQAALIGLTFAVVVPVMSVGMVLYMRYAGGGDVRAY